jgi:hypothetical protein
MAVSHKKTPKFPVGENFGGSKQQTGRAAKPDLPTDSAWLLGQFGPNALGLLGKA